MIKQKQKGTHQTFFTACERSLRRVFRYPAATQENVEPTPPLRSLD